MIISNIKEKYSHLFKTIIQVKRTIVRIGTKKQKIETGVNRNDLIKYFKLYVAPISCVYLIIIGKVATLRNTYNIDDDYNNKDYLCKFGYSEDLKRRMGQHYKKYGDQVELKYYSWIDSNELSKAECKIKNLLKNYRFDCEGHKEFLIINKKDMNNSVYDVYKECDESYAKETNKMTAFYNEKIEQLNLAMDNKDNEIIQLNLKMDVKDNEIKQLNLIIENLNLKMKLMKRDK